MGRVKKDLSRIQLPDREAHNSRLFVDLCENIHIHYRELRIVFSLAEYLEFVDVVSRSTEDVRNYLLQNPDYEEGKYPTTLMVAGGGIRQKKLLEHSPKPNRSTYFPNDFSIELQEESITDEIHVHWRDYRFALNREHFKTIASAFEEAKEKLEAFEKENHYERLPHKDRSIDDLSKEREKYKGKEARLQGEVDLDIERIQLREVDFETEKIGTRWQDITKEFKPNDNSIAILEKLYRKGRRVFPIVLSTEKDGTHKVIDGNHRLLAAKKSGLEKINVIVTDMTFDDSVNFRRAEGLLKRFDEKTGNKYSTVDFNRQYFAYKTNQYYKDHFYRKIRPSFLHRIKTAIKKLLGR